MTGIAVRVHDCEGCGAPLPAAEDGAHATCPFCGRKSVVDGNAAMVREERSRKEAESLFATLGRPPRTSQRIALALTSGWAWIVMPFLLVFLLRAVSAPQHAVEALWEHAFHERMVHVLPPWKAWLFEIGTPAITLLVVLVWSLFGERIDARRELQAALASKPPKTAGGPAICRACDAPLDVPPGALGARCAFCGADNLVEIPREWLATAKKIDATLRLNVRVAKQRAVEGRRRVLRAIAWRTPLVVGLLWLAMPSQSTLHRARWSDLAYRPTDHIGLYALAIRQEGGPVAHELETFADCRDARLRKIFAKENLVVGTTRCDEEACNAVGMFALARGERLHLQGAGTATVSLGDRDFGGGVAVLYDGFGDRVASGALPLDVEIATSGWYKVDARGDKGAIVEPCVTP